MKYKILIKFICCLIFVACSNNQTAAIDYYAKAKTEFKDICAEWELPERKDKFPAIANPEERKKCGLRIEAKAEELGLECHESKNRDPLVCDNILKLSSHTSERSINCQLDYHNYKLFVTSQIAELKHKKSQEKAMVSQMYNYLSTIRSVCDRLSYGDASSQYQDFDQIYQLEIAE